MIATADDIQDRSEIGSFQDLLDRRAASNNAAQSRPLRTIDSGPHELGELPDIFAAMPINKLRGCWVAMTIDAITESTGLDGLHLSPLVRTLVAVQTREKLEAASAAQASTAPDDPGDDGVRVREVADEDTDLINTITPGRGVLIPGDHRTRASMSVFMARRKRDRKIPASAAFYATDGGDYFVFDKSFPLPPNAPGRLVRGGCRSSDRRLIESLLPGQGVVIAARGRGIKALSALCSAARKSGDCPDTIVCRTTAWGDFYIYDKAHPIPADHPPLLQRGRSR